MCMRTCAHHHSIPRADPEILQKGGGLWWGKPPNPLNLPLNPLQNGYFEESVWCSITGRQLFTRPRGTWWEVLMKRMPDGFAPAAPHISDPNGNLFSPLFSGRRTRTRSSLLTDTVSGGARAERAGRAGPTDTIRRSRRSQTIRAVGWRNMFTWRTASSI